MPGPITVERDQDTYTFLWKGKPVGRILWASYTWMWELLDDDKVCERTVIDVDPSQREAFNSERQSIARLDDIIRDAMLAELEGRLRMFRDETVDMALMYGRSKARIIGQFRDQEPHSRRASDL